MDCLTDNIADLRAFLKGLWRDGKKGNAFHWYVPSINPYILKRIVEEYGFECIRIGEDGIDVIIPTSVNRWEYALKDIKIPSGWRCIDLGSGRNPWPKATIVADYYQEMDDYILPHQKFVKIDIQKQIPFDDKYFDFATCFHVLEHVSDPVSACKEISRVAKAGVIECPHALKDGLLLFQESDHRWHVFPPNEKGGPILFKAIDRDWMAKMHDVEAQIAAYEVYIGGRKNMGPSAVLRNYFARTEPLWNVIVHWEGSISAKIIE